jgi:ATP-binding cassette subfamily B protein
MGLAIRQLNNLLQMIRSLAVLTWLEDAAAVGRDAPMSGLQPPRALASGVSIRNVSFAYANSERPVLIDIDLDLRPGQRVAVVGENGAGKTTLVSLLCGFHQPTAGAITIDGTPLPHLDQRAWQRRVTAVFQEAARLEVELGESVGTGDLSIDGRGNTAVASHERVATAVDQAGLAELVDRFPDGLDTRLGRRFPNGHEISGGQWQKVLHARSTVREQPLLRVLDEPTAALDAQSEQDLFNRILHNSADTAITVFVSHRFSTVRDADHIVVLENGRVVEQGTHDDLVQAAGAYAELYERQARHYR